MYSFSNNFSIGLIDLNLVGRQLPLIFSARQCIDKNSSVLDFQKLQNTRKLSRAYTIYHIYL